MKETLPWPRATQPPVPPCGKAPHKPGASPRGTRSRTGAWESCQDGSCWWGCLGMGTWGWRQQAFVLQRCAALPAEGYLRPAGGRGAFKQAVSEGKLSPSRRLQQGEAVVIDDKAGPLPAAWPRSRRKARGGDKSRARRGAASAVTSGTKKALRRAQTALQVSKKKNKTPTTSQTIKQNKKTHQHHPKK